MDEKQKKENNIVFIGIGIILIISSFYIFKGAKENKKTDEDRKTTTENVLFSDYSYITASELNEKIMSREKIILLDPRDSASFEKNHIEGSINISDENSKETLDKLNKDDFIVIIGYDYEKKKDEASLAENLNKSEFKNFKALSGGITGWAQEGNQMISGGDKESAIDWSKIDQIIPEQLKLAIDNNYPVFIIDTRKSFLYASGHIPKAVNIPIEELEQRKSEIPISKEILVYGATADDDFKASVKLNDMGYLATFTLQGGLNAWQEKRFEIEK